MLCRLRNKNTIDVIVETIHRFIRYSHLFGSLEVAEDAVGAVVDLGERANLGVVCLARVCVQHAMLVGHARILAILKSETSVLCVTTNPSLVLVNRL